MVLNNVIREENISDKRYTPSTSYSMFEDAEKWLPGYSGSRYRDIIDSIWTEHSPKRRSLPIDGLTLFSAHSCATAVIV
jgi:hypothetical protein